MVAQRRPCRKRSLTAARDKSDRLAPMTAATRIMPSATTPKIVIPPKTRLAQTLASDPGHSAWVSANAGSGKTFVLVQRVLRLLLTGVPPAQILCLTFTKAAAANMTTRVFETLARWTGLNDAALGEAIAELNDGDFGIDLDFARSLFARALDTPGGLKIQTIHAFCERLLHQFPFEANVAAGFEVIDDLERESLIETARQGALLEASGGAGELAVHLATLAAETSEPALDALVREALGRRLAIEAMIWRCGGLQPFGEALRRHFGLGREESLESIRAAILDPTILAALAEGFDRGSAKDRDKAAILRGLDRHDPAALGLYAALFLREGVPRARALSAGLARADPAFAGALANETQRLIGLLERERALRTVNRTLALFGLLSTIFAIYGRLKARRNRLDFDDLIERSLALLTRSDAAWVLYKLDSGIDHILIDEAQDTSIEQWEILRRLSEEFLAGSDRPRTFFAVGDAKQSIFSFQGAAPEKFDAMRRYFEQRLREARKGFVAVELTLSFRSVDDVLSAVDLVFSLEPHYRGLTGGGDPVKPVHEARKGKLPGSVEIWPVVSKSARVSPRDWRLPVDALDDEDPPVLVARRMASVIAAMIATGSNERVSDAEGRPRPIRPGDIMILVRSRNAVFEAMIRALKESDVPVAGADRLRLTQHIAVMDLIAAGRAALLSEDDLTLACVLKSPLIGLDDDDLIHLAPRRPGTLASALDAARGLERYGAAAARLQLWRERARRLSPFEFYALLLGADGGRKAFLARLGQEAGDVIDEFLKLALDHQKYTAPSLKGFLAELESAELIVKRDMDGGHDVVRVMTVHAAKGLEAKIVFLPDTCSLPDGHHDPKIFDLGPLAVWSARQADDPQDVAKARQIKREAALDEYRRLLYVALTRAEERLVIAGFEGKQTRPPACWYDMISTTLEAELLPAETPWGQVWRRQRAAPLPALDDTASVSRTPQLPLPDWLARPPGSPFTRLAPLRPSGPAAALSATSPRRGRALARGRLVHRLLQYLPEIDGHLRKLEAARFLAGAARGWDAADRQALIDEVMAVIEAPGHEALFGPGSRAEVPIAGRITRGGGTSETVLGQVDRLIEAPHEVLVVDFKDGEPQPALPAAYVRQLALYGAILAQIYPGRTVRAFILWTSGPSMIEIDAANLVLGGDHV
jgi:ATP-dependent helicase/nuclease subunit A